jgi:cytochrome P450
MSPKPKPDWEPRSPEVQGDQRAAYDAMRARCPVAYSEYLQWSLFRHADVTRVLHDHATFSNVVSKHLSVPNGMDPPEHTEYRRIIERYFTPALMEEFEPACRNIVVELVEGVLAQGEVEFMTDCALPFALRAQVVWLGWPPQLQEALLRWTRANFAATLAQDRETLAQLAAEFEGYINEMLEVRRRENAPAKADVTASLLHETVQGRPLTNEEIASILRNWTGGEVSTLSAALGILVHFLAVHPEVQQQLRENPALIGPANDEILRIHGPLVSNRRVATAPVELGGRKLEAGTRLTLNWIAANRDPEAFEHPEEFRLDRDPSKNLLYGAGIHVCPGAPLARMELRVAMEELLRRSTTISTLPDKLPVNATFPSSGYVTVPLLFR